MSVRKNRAHKIEFKKIGFLLLLVFTVVFVVVGRISELLGICIDTSTDVSLVYTVCGAFVSYCAASASDKINIAKNGFVPELGKDYEKSDGSE